MMECCFYDAETNSCSILNGKNNCRTCKFFKTAFQYAAEQRKADDILARKGLERYKTADNIIRTRPIRKDWYND